MTLTSIQRVQIGLAVSACIAAVLIITSVNSVMISGASLAKTDTPDFSSFNNATDKKKAFYAYLLPLIGESNQLHLANRERLLAIAEKFESEDLTTTEESQLAELALAYKVDENLSTEEQITELLLRVDVIPPSLALAQAAQESGWGTSNFARNANNYFGQRCFEDGCGLHPLERAEGANHLVKMFESSSQSLAAYMQNLNTHDAYEDLRDLRAELRNQNKLSGIILANQLGRYSEQGQDYIEAIQTIIRVNNLEQFDRLF